MRRERYTGGLFKRAGSRFFYAQFYRDGRQVRVATKTDVKEEAQRMLRKLISNNENGVVSNTELKKVMYEDLRAGLLANYMERGNKSLQTLADGEETIWGLKPLDEFFKGKSVTHITMETARKFAKARLDEGLSNDTVNGSLRLLRRMLNIAREDGKIAIVPKIRMLKNGAARQGFLARESFDKLVSNLPEHLRPLVTFLYYCGVRLGEACQIEWSQVDLDAALIRLEEDQTKNSEARTVPLPAALVDMLRELPKGGPVFDSTNIRRAWRVACAKSGLGTLTRLKDSPESVYVGLIIHDLRRSAIKNLMKAGVNEKVAMKISGHKTRNVFDRYHIVDTADVTDAMSRVQQNGKFGDSTVAVAQNQGIAK